MRDYMSDYQTYLNSSLLELLVEDLFDAFLVVYLTALGNTQKLRMPAAVERIKDDVSQAFKFFSTLKPAKELESYFEVVEMVLSLLEASKSLAFLSFWSFAKVHGPNLAFVESLMKARGDLDRSSVNEVMDSIKRKVKEENLTDRGRFSFQPRKTWLIHLSVRRFSTRTYDNEEDYDRGNVHASITDWKGMNTSCYICNNLYIECSSGNVTNLTPWLWLLLSRWRTTRITVVLYL